MSTTGEGGTPGPLRTRAGSVPAAEAPGQGTRTGQEPRSREGSMARTQAPRPRPEGRPGQPRGGTPAGQQQRPLGPRPAGSPPPRRRRRGPRRVRLTLQRVDPWSVMKISFLVSVAIGIAGVVMVAVLWTVLSGMGVFADVNGLVTDITSGEGGSASFDLMNYVGFGRVVSLAVVIGVIDVILLTAMATLGAFLYNICTSLVGGAQLTLSDE